MICELVVVQTHWYVSPYSCSGGDYWNPGELQFICPGCSVRNRLLFNGDTYEIKKERKGAEHVFSNMYRGLFKEVVQEYEHDTPGSWVNNYYLDSIEVRGLFELPPRTEKLFGPIG